jgi:hypothetical protein
MSKEPMRITIDCERVANWLEKLAKLAYSAPMVRVDVVAKDPAQAMYHAIVEMQDNISSVVSDICSTCRVGRSVYSAYDIINQLRQEETTPAAVAGENPDAPTPPAAGEGAP